MMPPDLEKHLSNCGNLPTLPGIAHQIIALANEPQADIDRIAQLLALDPALTIKVLRVANSAFYAQRRRSENVRQGIVLLGLNATISLALSFSLLKSWKDDATEGGLDYPKFWRRALLSVTVSRAIADAVGIRDAESLFLCALIQDIGMMALDRSGLELYQTLDCDQTHQEAIVDHERNKIRTDHGVVGGWLLERWHFPERIHQAVSASHNLKHLPGSSKHTLFTRCVPLTGLIAEVFSSKPGNRPLTALAESARELLRMDNERLMALLEEVGALVPEAEAVFETELLIESDPEVVLYEAREALLLKNLGALRAADDERNKTDYCLHRVRQLEEISQRDKLTQVYNREFLDQVLDAIFSDSNKTGKPMSIAVVDLDKFKVINDNYGHQAGDQILVAIAEILKSNVREFDLVVRFGGDEFMLILPDTGHELAKTICERVARVCSESLHDLGEAETVTAKVSIGAATHGDEHVFRSTDELVRAADRALYTAKRRGRGTSVHFDPVAPTKPTQFH